MIKKSLIANIFIIWFFSSVVVAEEATAVTPLTDDEDIETQAVIEPIIDAEDDAETKAEVEKNEAKAAVEQKAIIEQVMEAEKSIPAESEPSKDATTRTGDKLPVAEESTEPEAGEAAKDWIPSAVGYDWIQLVSNEWLKGEIKGMYRDSLEFDSDELNLLTIDWEKVKILRTYRVNYLNIEGVGATSGILEVTDDSLQVTNDYEDKTYDRKNLISFAPAGIRERDLWAVKFTLSLDVKQGNTNKLDYMARASVKRRASTTQFLLDYIGNITKTGNIIEEDADNVVETINNHRVTASYDYYKTRRFFYTPLFGEFYRNPFTNTDMRASVGAGMGYTLIDNGRTELSIAGGPAYIRTDFVSVAPGEEISVSTLAAVVRTNYEVDIFKAVDFIAKYNIGYGNKESGGYTHHVILTLETEITGSLDVDISFVWDRTSYQTEDANGNTPVPNDYRTTFGISYTF